MPTTTAVSSTNHATGSMESSNETNTGDNSKDPPVDVDDDIAPDSEVKVYTNEDEDGVPETESALSRKDESIENVKTGLINESEQCKDARTGDQLAFARSFLHEETTLYQYLLNQQAASCALPDNVLNRGNSPASGSAATHPGLQPSLYHLPPLPPNYHYPMLGPAQLEALHQYQSGTLHVGSPYNLPINTLGYMQSRFSPGGLHGHHPGLAPAGSGPQGDHPHINHINPTDLKAASNVNHHPNVHGSSHSEQTEKECKSRFSPGGLNGHNPGLSPAAALGLQGGHPRTLPHIKTENLDAVSNVNHHPNVLGSSHSEQAEKECKSRFSPGGLYEHNPGLSPGAALGLQADLSFQPVSCRFCQTRFNYLSAFQQHYKIAHEGHPHTLPHIKPENLDAVSNVNHHESIHSGEKEKAEKECLVKKKDVNRIPKPLNAFMLYMQEMRPIVKAECTLKESAAINKILGRRWKGLTRNEQQKYYEKARSAQELHMEMYPDWQARDNYRKGLNKNKKKRDKSDGIKKCRARYGLEHQDAWCKLCKRKKKCIRAQSYNETNIARVGQPGQSAGDGEEDNINDFDDNDHSPDSTSLGSTFEQSLTSPAEFSSLGSSASSIASLSTPQTIHDIDHSPDSSLGSTSEFSSLNSLGSSDSTASLSTPQTFEALGDFLRTSATM